MPQKKSFFSAEATLGEKVLFFKNYINRELKLRFRPGQPLRIYFFNLKFDLTAEIAEALKKQYEKIGGFEVDVNIHANLITFK